MKTSTEPSMVPRAMIPRWELGWTAMQAGISPGGKGTAAKRCRPSTDCGPLVAAAVERTEMGSGTSQTERWHTERVVGLTGCSVVTRKVKRPPSSVGRRCVQRRNSQWRKRVPFSDRFDRDCPDCNVVRTQPTLLPTQPLVELETTASI